MIIEILLLHAMQRKHTSLLARCRLRYIGRSTSLPPHFPTVLMKGTSGLLSQLENDISIEYLSSEKWCRRSGTPCILSHGQSHLLRLVRRAIRPFLFSHLLVAVLGKFDFCETTCESVRHSCGY